MADPYTLPQQDPCYSTLEAYKHTLAAPIDDYWHAARFRELGTPIERWQRCCPELQEKAARLRPEKTDLKALTQATQPAGIFGPHTACAKELSYSGTAADPLSRGQAWFKRENALREKYWGEQYTTLAKELHTCCVTHFNDCLGKAASQSGFQAPTGAATAQCVERFSPEHQPAPVAADRPVPAGPPPAAADRLSALERAAKKLEEAAGIREQAAPSAAQTAAADERGFFLQKLRQCDATLALAEQARDRLQDELQATRAHVAPRPGPEALQAFPSGIGSAELALCGGIALAAGFLLGFPGRSGPRSQLLSCALSAGLALLAYLGIVFFLPDTRLPHLLLALTAAVLFAALRTLGRVYVLLRQQRWWQTP